MDPLRMTFLDTVPVIDLATTDRAALRHMIDEACRAWGLRYLYLGLYVADCRHLAYKARFLPHERLIQGEWRRFDRPAEARR